MTNSGTAQGPVTAAGLLLSLRVAREHVGYRVWSPSEDIAERVPLSSGGERLCVALADAEGILDDLIHSAAALAATSTTSELAGLDGAGLIAAERQRQVAVEGYDAAHDKGHADDLAFAAAAYAIPDAGLVRRGLSLTRYSIWPWAIRYWKPTPDDRIRELVKAGALIAAAIDSLRAGQPKANHVHHFVRGTCACGLVSDVDIRLSGDS